jgi:RNA polymerase sigma-70 factor (ECF subfamily)
MSSKYTDKSVIESLLRTDGEEAIRLIYAEYYEVMCNVVWRVLNDKNTAEDVVQEVIMEIWRKRETIVFSTSIYGYLKRSCVNRSLNTIRRNKVKIEDDTALQYQATSDHTHNNVEAGDLQGIISNTIMTLPDRCRQVFVLSRYEYLSYKEIGDQLDISVKTVENQIAKALKLLRASVSPYMNETV